ncbi:MAG: methyl-accepting chemotaxis protein [Roseburia sp.]|nr:methyl-accepting chemotaxis protein [Roseburia sp.]
MGMNNIKVRTKLVIVMVIALIALVLCSIVSNTSLSGLGNNALDIIENDMRSSYDEQIKAQVDNVISLCQSIYNRYEKGEYTLDEAEKLAADQIRDLRYGNNGYFWVDTYDGTNVVLLGNDTEGTNRMDAVDTNGFAYMQAIISAGRQENGGFTDYVFPREGETEPSPKRAYSKAFEPFGWVLGTGNYTDDIDDEVLGVKNGFSSFASNSRMQIIGIAVVMEVILILVLTMITVSIVKPLRKSLTHINEMAQGDFSKEFEQNLLKRKDDFGQLADSLEKMRSEMKELIGEVKSEALEITGMVQEIDTSIRALDDQIENVSATTEELAAGMEETAASSEEINAMSHEIESAAKSIAERSQDGANEADEIRERAVKIKKDTDENDRRTRSIHEEINESLTKALEDIKVVDQINVLAKSIMDITGQTNLLALNASIEAARAGEAGKGFAVVADEIRVLAEQSKAAVAHIQEVTGNVTAAVENLANDAERLLEFVGNDVVESLGGFAEMANSYNSDAANVDSLVTDFSASSEQLLASINGVMDAISDVSKTATEGATGTTDIAEKVGNVVQEAEAIKQKAETTYHSAEKLQKNVERFIV